jgi:hypothetical protein
MNKHRKARSVLVTGLFLLLAGLAQAQAIEDRTAHQRFACLQRERELEPLAAKTPELHNAGVLRLQLKFVAADKPPRVEVLHSQGDADMERIAKRYVEGYRLPCLHAKDHPVEVVQEFSFHRWGTEAPVHVAGEAKLAKVQTPTSQHLLTSDRVFEPGKALVEFSFVEGREEPEVRLIFAGVNRGMQRNLESHVRQYRLDADVPRPFTARQQFNFVSYDTKGTKYRLSQDEFKLIDFLRMTTNVREHLVDIDLDSMACPFAVRVNLRQPYEPNGVFELETQDPNRAYLLNWLSKLQLRFSSEAQQQDLYGSDMRIQIPCGRLNLMPKPAAS